MARRNQNTFLKRQKEIERVRKAREKMDRRHGKKRPEEEPTPEEAPVDPAPEPEGDVGTEAPAAESPAGETGTADDVGPAATGSRTAGHIPVR